jgi:redox-regulated HSP33 family molecular chaperone
MGLVYLTSRQVQFFCPCSKEYFLLNMQSLYGENPYQLFGDQTQIEVKCDYCLKKYHFIHKDFENPLQ